MTLLGEVLGGGGGGGSGHIPRESGIRKSKQVPSHGVSFAFPKTLDSLLLAFILARKDLLMNTGYPSEFPLSHWGFEGKRVHKHFSDTLSL